MIVLCILAVVWLSVRAAATCRMCVRMADRENAGLDADWRLREPRDAAPPSVRRVGPVPQDAPYAPQDTVTSERCDGLSLALAVVVAMRQQATTVFDEAGSWVTGVKPASSNRPGVPVRPTGPSFCAVPRPASGPAFLGGRDDLAYLRGWDDAVDWISDAHDAAPPTWGGVAYMTGWDDAVRAIAKARVSA